MEAAALVEEMDLKEILDNITEESECQSSKEGGGDKSVGREDKGDLDRQEGDCFRQRQREALDRGMG